MYLQNLKQVMETITLMQHLKFELKVATFGLDASS